MTGKFMNFENRLKFQKKVRREEVQKFVKDIVQFG